MDETKSSSDQLSTSSGSQFTNIVISPHSVAAKYREIEERLKRAKLQCEKLNNELENQLDARDRLFRDTDRLAQWVMSAEKRLAKLTRVWVAARPPIIGNKSYGMLNKPSSIMKQKNDQVESDKQHLLGVDLPEAYEQLKALLTEARGPRMLALKELACQIEGEEVDLAELSSKASSSRPGSNRPDSSSSSAGGPGAGTGASGRPTSGRSRSRRSVSFDLLGKEGSFDSTTDELNRQLHDRLIRLLSKLNRLISRLDQRTVLCRLTMDYEFSRQGWIQEINALNSRLKSFTNTSVVVELNVDKKNKRQTPTTSKPSSAKEPVMKDEEGNEGVNEESKEDIASREENENEEKSSQPAPVLDTLKVAADDAEHILAREQTTPSGIAYQSEYNNLKLEVGKLKESINKWQVTLDFSRSDNDNTNDTIENGFDETLTSGSNLCGPKQVDVAAVSTGLMFVTHVDSNWSFGAVSTGASLPGGGNTSTLSDQSTTTTTTLQVEPFSFFVDIARLSSECDKLHAKLKANLFQVISVCENWQQLVEGRDRLVEQVKDLQTRSTDACYTVSSMGDPLKTDKAVGIRLTRLGNQLLDWQTELNSAGNDTEEVNKNEQQAEKETLVDKTNLPSEAVVIIQRLGDLRRAGDRIVSSTPARGPNVDSLYNTTIQCIRLCAIHLGELGRHSILLSDVLSKREECLNQLTEFINDVEKQSGLIPVSDYSSFFGDELPQQETAKGQVGDQQQEDETTMVKQPIPEEIISQLTSYECMDVCRLLSVDSTKEVDQRLLPIRAALDSLLSKQDSMFLQLHQLCSLALQTYHSFHTEVCKRQKPTSDVEDNQTEEQSTTSSRSSDPFRDAIMNRWRRLQFLMETAIQQLSIRRGAFKYIEDGFSELESWLGGTELTLETCSSQLAASSAAFAILLPLNNMTRSQLPSDEELEFSENPQVLLDTYTTEVVYYSSLLNSISERIGADLADRITVKKTFDALEWRLHRLQKSADHLTHQWNEEGERCEQLQVDMRKFDSLLESIGKELTASFDSSSASASDELNNRLSQQSGTTDLSSIKVIATQANNYLLQLCKAQCIRYRLTRLREHSLWLHDRAHLLAIGPSRYHHRSLYSLKQQPQQQESFNVSNNECDKVTSTTTAGVLMESESVSLNHRLSGLISRSTKCVHILHLKVNHLFFDIAQNFHLWFNDLQSRSVECQSTILLLLSSSSSLLSENRLMSKATMMNTTQANVSSIDNKSDQSSSVQILFMESISSNLEVLYTTIQNLEEKTQECDSKLDYLKELAKIMLRSQFIDIDPTVNNQPEADHHSTKDTNQLQPSPPTDLEAIHQTTPTTESLLKSIEDQVDEQLTVIISNTDVANSDPSVMLTNLNSDTLSFTQSNSANQLIRLWEGQLIQLCSQLKQFESRVNTARQIIVQSRQYENSLTKTLKNYESQSKRSLFWSKKITIDLCKSRLNELQQLLTDSEGTRSELKQAHETFHQLVKLCDTSSSSSNPESSAFQLSDTPTAFEESTQETTDVVNNIKSSKSVVYKSAILLDIELRLTDLIVCLRKAIHHTTELISALESQQRLYKDADDWLSEAISQLENIITEKQKTSASHDKAKKYLDLFQKLNENSSAGQSKVQSAQSAIEQACCLLLTSESFLPKPAADITLSPIDDDNAGDNAKLMTDEKSDHQTASLIIADQSSFTSISHSYRSKFITELHSHLCNCSQSLRNRLDTYLDEIAVHLSEIELDLGQWTSYTDSKSRLEQWLSDVEVAWKVDQLTTDEESDEIIVEDDSTKRMYYITLYKQRLQDIHSHENLLNTVIDRGNQFTHKNTDSNEELFLPTEEILAFRKRFETLKEFTNSRLNRHEDRLKRYRKFLEQYEKFDEWLSNAENRIIYIIEDLAENIDYLLPDMLDKMDIDFSVENSNSIKRSVKLSSYIDEINKLWLSILTNSEDQLHTIDTLFQSIREEIQNPVDLETKINTRKDHLYVTLQQKIDDLIEKLKEYQRIGEEFFNNLSSIQKYLTDQEKRLLKFSPTVGQVGDESSKLSAVSTRMTPLPDSQEEKIRHIETLNQISTDLNSLECSRLIETLNDSRDRLISLLNIIRQLISSSSSSPHPRSIVISSDRLDKYLNYINQYLTRLKNQCGDLLKHWQLAVDNHKKFVEAYKSCQIELTTIRTTFTQGYSDVDQSMTVVVDNCWSRGDQLYTRQLVWLTDLTHRLDRFSVISYQSCIELLQATSQSTSMKGYDSLNEQLIQLKQSANQLSNEINTYYHRIESAMSAHLRIVEEKRELESWLTEEKQKIDELMSKPLTMTSLGGGGGGISALSASASSTSFINSLNVHLSSWSHVISERQSILQSLKRILQNLSSRSQQLRSFEERQSLAVLNFKTYLIDRVKTSGDDADGGGSSDTSSSAIVALKNITNLLNEDYTSLINRNKEIIAQLEKIIELDTKFYDFTISLSSDINSLSDNLNVYEKSLGEMKPPLLFVNDGGLINSQELWTRELVQNKINELNQQMKGVCLMKSIHEKLKDLQEISSSSNCIEPEKNMANEIVDLLKTQISQSEERIDQLIALYHLILSQMQDMLKAIQCQEEWHKQVVNKIELYSSQLPIDLEAKKALVKQYQTILSEVTDHRTEINEILRNCTNNTISSSVTPPKAVELTEPTEGTTSDPPVIKIYPADIHLVKRLKTFDHELNQTFEKVNLQISRWKCAVIRHENFIQSIKTVETVLIQSAHNIYYCAQRILCQENEANDVELLKFPASSILIKCINILKTYIDPRLMEVNRLLDDINLTYDSILVDTCAESMNSFKVQVRGSQRQLTSLEHQLHTLQSFLANLNDRLELFHTLEKTTNERLSNIIDRIQSEGVNLCSTSVQEIKRYINSWHGIRERAKQMRQSYAEEMTPLIEEFQQLKTEHSQFLEVYRKNFTLSCVDNEDEYLQEQLSTIEFITVQSTFNQRSEKLSEIVSFIDTIISIIETISTAWCKAEQKFTQCRAWLNGLTKKFVQIAQSQSVSVDNNETRSEVMMNVDVSPSSVSPTSNCVVGQLDHYTAQTRLSLLLEFQAELNQSHPLHFDEYRDALKTIQSLDTKINSLYDILKNQFDVHVTDSLKLNQTTLICKLEEDLEKYLTEWKTLNDQVDSTHKATHQYLEQVEEIEVKQSTIRKLLTELEQKALMGPDSSIMTELIALEKESATMTYSSFQQSTNDGELVQEDAIVAETFEKLITAQKNIIDWWEVFTKQLEEEIPKVKEDIKAINTMAFPSPTGLLNQLLRVEEISVKAHEFLHLNQEGLTSLNDIIKSWHTWQYWWTVESKASDILTQGGGGGPCNLVNSTTAFNNAKNLDTTELITVHEQLKHLNELNESQGKMKLIDLTDKLNLLQVFSEKLKNPIINCIISQSHQQQQQQYPLPNQLNQYQTTPLQMTIVFIQRLIRLANHQYSLIFDDLPLAIDQLSSKITIINNFLNEYNQFIQILNDNEKSIEKLEIFFKLRDNNNNSSNQVINERKENSYQVLQLLNIDFSEMTKEYFEVNFENLLSMSNGNQSIRWNESICIDFLNQLTMSVKLLSKMTQSNSEKLYSLEKSSCMLKVLISQTSQQSSPTGQEQFKLIELETASSRYSQLVKRTQLIVRGADSYREIINKLIQTYNSLEEWIKQLERNITNYANLSGDRHTLQTRLELVKKRLDLSLLTNEACNRFTDVNKYAMECFVHCLPPQYQDFILAVDNIDVEKTASQIFENFLNLPMNCVHLLKVWFDCCERIEFILKSLSQAIETWQVFEVACDTSQLTCRRIENWLKEQSMSLVNKPEEIEQKLELLQFVCSRLEVKLNVDACEDSEVSDNSGAAAATCQPNCEVGRQHEQVLEFLNELTLHVGLLNSTLKRLPNRRHQLYSRDVAIVDDTVENVNDDDDTLEAMAKPTSTTASEVVVSDSYDSAMNRIKGITVLLSYLQKVTREVIDLWKIRVKLFTEWNCKIQNTEESLARLCVRTRKVKEKFTSVGEEEQEEEALGVTILLTNTDIDDNNDIEGVKTIDDYITLIDDIMKARELIGAEFTELRNRLCNMTTFIDRVGHNSQQHRMGEVQRNWEELGNSLMNLHRNLEHRTTLWTDLTVQVANLFNWFNEFNDRIQTWLQSRPWLNVHSLNDKLDASSSNTLQESMKSSTTTLILNEFKQYSKETNKYIKQTESYLNLARAQHSKVAYFQTELKSCQLTDIQTDAYNQLCNKLNQSIDLSNQLIETLNTTFSIGNDFQVKINSFIKQYKVFVSSMNAIRIEFDQSISSIPKIDQLKSDKQNVDDVEGVKSLIKERSLTLNNLIDQIGDGQQLNNLLIDTLNEKIDQSFEKAEEGEVKDEVADGENKQSKRIILVYLLRNLLKKAYDIDAYQNALDGDEVTHPTYRAVRCLIYESIQLRETLSQKLITITNETEDQLRLDSMLNHFDQQLKLHQDEMNQLANRSIYRSKSFELNSIDNMNNNENTVLPVKSSSLNTPTDIDHNINMYLSRLKQTADDCGDRIAQLENSLHWMTSTGKDDLFNIEQTLNNYQQKIGKLDLKFSRCFNELKSKHEITLNKMRKFKNQLTKEYESWQEFLTNEEKADSWLSNSELCSKKVLFAIDISENEDDDENNDDNNKSSDEHVVKAVDDKELLSKQLTSLEQLEIDFKEHGKELREHVEQSARQLLFNLIPNSFKSSSIIDKTNNNKSDIIDYINIVVEHLFNRYNQYKLSLQTIHSNLSEKYLCWSKLDSNLQQMNRWLHNIDLQLNTMEMETNSLSTILINDISMHKIDEHFAIHQLNAWCNSKLCILTNLLDELRRYSETELIQLEELVQAQCSIDRMLKEHSSNDSDNNNNNSDIISGKTSSSLGRDATDRLNCIFKKYDQLKGRLESLIHLNHVILNLCEKFVRKRCEIFQWLLSQRRELDRLMNQTESYSSSSVQSQAMTKQISSMPNTEVSKLCQLFDKTTCDLEDFKTSLSVTYQESLGDLIKLIEELGQMTPLRMEPAETYVADLKRDVTEFFNHVTQRLEYFRVWSEQWSNFSLDCNTLSQWLSEQCSSLLSILYAESSSGTGSSTSPQIKTTLSQITSSDMIEKEFNRLTDRVSRSRQLRIDLIGRQPCIESLVMTAQSLIKSRIISSSGGGRTIDDALKALSSSAAADESAKSHSLAVGGNIALNAATHLMEQYQTLLSVCDRRLETGQTLQKMIEQLLTSCKSYDQWACELRMKISDVEPQLTAYESCSVTSGDSDNKSSMIRMSIVDMESRIESGESLIQVIKGWTDQYTTESIMQGNQYRSEIETLLRLTKYDSSNLDQLNSIQELENDNNQSMSVSIYTDMDYYSLKSIVQSLRDRYEKIVKSVNQRNLSQEKFTNLIETTENQLELINAHVNLYDLSKIITLSTETKIDDFDKLIENVTNHLHSVSETITQLAIDTRKYEAEMKNSEFTIDSQLGNRFAQAAQGIQSTHQEISTLLRLFHQFHNEAQIFSAWIIDCETKFIRLSEGGGDSNRLAVFFHSDSLTQYMDDHGDDADERIMHQLDESCRSLICQLTEAKQKLLIIKEINSVIESRGHQLNKQLIESGEQLTSRLKILEESGVQLKSTTGDRAASVTSSNRLSVIIQNYIDQLQCRLIRLDRIQSVFTTNLTELVDRWTDWKNSFDRLIDWLNGTATNLRRPIFHSLDSLSTKQQLANSLKAFYQDCVGKKADFDLCLLKANHVKSLAPNCNLPNQSEQLFEQYKNTLDTAYAALQQMQNSVEIHEQFDSDVARITQWLENIDFQLNSLSSSVDENTDRVTLEQNLLACQNLSEMITCQSETLISQLVIISDQVCRTTDSLTNKEILDKVDVFRQSIRCKAQQLTDIQTDIETKLGIITNWENAKSNVVNILNGICQSLLTTTVLHRKTSAHHHQQQQQVQPMTLNILLTVKEEHFKQFQNIKSELEPVQMKIGELRKCTEKYLQFERRLDIQRQVDQLVDKYAKIQSEIDIHLVKIDKELQNLRVFHTKIDESKSWLLQISLKLMAIHSTDADGPQGVIQLGQIENHLRKHLNTFMENNLIELKSLLKNYPTEQDLSIEIDRIVHRLFPTPYNGSGGGISINSAEQIIDYMNQLKQSVEGSGEQDDQFQISESATAAPSPSGAATATSDDRGRVHLWKELFQLEIVQLESNCENLLVMCKRIKDRLMEQQHRWAKFVSVLLRIDNFLRLELVEWWRLANVKKLPCLNTAKNDDTKEGIDDHYAATEDLDVSDDESTSSNSSLQSENSREVQLVFFEENSLMKKQDKKDTSKQSSSLSIQELLAEITNAKAVHAKLQIYLQELSAARHRCSTPPPRPTVSTNLASLTKYYDPSTMLTEILGSTSSQNVNNVNSSLPVGAGNNTTTVHELSSNNKVQMSEETMNALSGSELRRKASHINEQLEIELKRLDKHIESLQDLKVRWDQQNLCETEFLNWLHQKRNEFDQIIHQTSASHLQQQTDRHHHYTQLSKAMDTARLDSLLNELKAKKTIIEQLKRQSKSLIDNNRVSDNIKLIESEYGLLVTKIQENINSRRLLTNQALEATRLTDRLHSDLHDIVKRSTGIDTVQCSTDVELKKMGWEHSNKQLTTTTTGSVKPYSSGHQYKVSKPPSFCGHATSSSNHQYAVMTKHHHERASTPIPMSSVQLTPPATTTAAAGPISQSDYHVQSTSYKPLDNLTTPTATAATGIVTDWLWFSPSSLLPDSSLQQQELPIDINESWDMDPIPSDVLLPPSSRHHRCDIDDNEVEGEGDLADRSRSSSRVSLIIQRPWSAFRKFDRSVKNRRRGEISESDTTTSISREVELGYYNKHRPKSIFSQHLKPIRTPLLHRPSNLWRSQSAKVLPLDESNMDKMMASQSIWNVSGNMDPLEDSTFSVERYTTSQSPMMIPMLLRRSVSPIVSKTFGSRGDGHRRRMIPLEFGTSIRHSGIVDIRPLSAVSRRHPDVSSSPNLFDYPTAVASHSRGGGIQHSFILDKPIIGTSHSFPFRPSMMTSVSHQNLQDAFRTPPPPAPGPPLHSIRVSGLSGYEFPSPSVSEYENVFSSGRPQPMGASISDNLLSPKIKSSTSEQAIYDLTRRRATEPPFYRQDSISSLNRLRNRHTGVISTTTTATSIPITTNQQPTTSSSAFDSIRVVRPQTIAQLAVQRYRNQQLQQERLHRQQTTTTTSNSWRTTTIFQVETLNGVPV
ncbi:unnamed protein product [Trichobilharzia szidati]|nr:unnamed protein product [Trichobilharzia szidati]